MANKIIKASNKGLTESEQRLISALNFGPFKSNLEWAKQADVSTDTLYDALNRSRFLQAIQNYHLRRTYYAMDAVLDRMISAAKGDSFRDRQLLAEMWGLYNPRAKMELSGPDGGPIRLSLGDIIKQLQNPGNGSISVEEVDDDDLLTEGDFLELPEGDLLSQDAGEQVDSNSTPRIAPGTPGEATDGLTLESSS
jgi:hypothetical protein